MAARKFRLLAIWLTCGCVLMAFGYFILSKQFELSSRMWTFGVNIHENLNVFNASNEPEADQDLISKFKCVPLKTTEGNTPICIYNPIVDKYISGSILRDGMWDTNGVHLMASILKDNPDIQVLDLGCNIGVFTLQALKMGRKVVAVDANKFNLGLLSRSLKLGGLQQNATLIWNAISNAYETIQLTITTGNIGASYVAIRKLLNVQPKFKTQEAQTIKLDDLIGFVKGKPLFIKMDIEKSEWKAFQGGERFFHKVDAKYILMEWEHYRNNKNGGEFAQYISNFGYRPYEPKANSRNVLQITSFRIWPNDVLWIKDSGKNSWYPTFYL